MNISFKNIPKFQYGGKGVSGVGNNGTWYNDVGQYTWEAIINKLQRAGEDNTYMYWLNGMQHAHDHLYDAYRDTINTPTFDVDTQAYQRAYKGELNPKEFDNTYLSTKDLQKLGSGFLDNYNNYGIQKAFKNNVFTFPKNPRSGDNPQRGFIADGYFSGITDYRRLLGRKGDYTDEQLTALNKRLNAIGYNLIEYPEMYGDYYALVRLSNPVAQTATPPAQPASPEKTPIEKQWEDNYRGLQEEADLVKSWEDDYRRRQEGSIRNGGTDVETGKMKEKFDWSKIRLGLQRALPDILEAGRLIGNYYNNERVYGEQLKGIHPDLIQSYQTHRQVVGDEATKQSYYRRAAQGETKAAQPFTSDADRQMAYQFEAKRIGDELRAQGDLADNQEIRRTSDESNQHQWANIQRNTEVANANLKSINYADSLRHNLLAQKHAANWTSFDNYLQGVGYKIKQRAAEEKNLQDQIFTLQEQLDAQNDPQFLNLISNLEKVVKKHTDSSGIVDWKHPDITNAQKDLQSYKIERTIQSLKDKYKRNISIVKSGGKVTQKKKDDLLYKQVKDSVEHFRKMSKMSSDAQNRKRIKIDKLTSHPKSKKYQQGGVAPFTIYKPIILGGETTTSREYSTSSSSSKSSSSSEGKESLDLVKKLFESLVGKGLPIDVNQIYVQMNNLIQRSKVFGTELSTEDIASMYLSALQQVNTVQYYKDLHDNAKERVDAKNANYEWAIDPVTGKVAVQNRNTGEVGLRRFEEIDLEVENPLTNQNLLDLRSKSPNLAFDDQTISIVSNATSMDEIAKFLKAQVPTIQSTETTLEGYTKKDTNLIKEGVRILSEAPDGDYKYSETYKSNSAQINKALAYLYNILPQNMKTLLKTKGNPKKLIETMLGAGEIFEHKYGLNEVKNTNEEDKNALSINSAVQLLLGMSSPREFTFNIGNGNSFQGFARISSINDVNETPFGSDFSYSEIYKSSLRKNLDLDNACFGDIPINKALKDRIIVDNSTIAGVDLPYIVTKEGRIVPDFDLLNRVEEADQDIMRRGIDLNNYQAINAVYVEHKLPIKYDSANQLTDNYKRFAVIQATAIEDVFLNKNGLASNGTLTLVSDEEERDKYLEEIKKITGKKKIDMDRPGIWTGDKDIFKGSIFIPIIGDLVDAISGSHTGNLTSKNYDQYRSQWQTKNYVNVPEQ